MNEKEKAEISVDLNRMLMEMYDKGIADAESAAMKAIEAAVLAEREACAKLCEKTKAPKIRDEWSAGHTTGCSSCAAAIRARG